MDRRALIFVAAAFLPPFTVYWLTRAETWALDTIYTIDSAEMVLAAWTLGIDHPPGHPLYLILAHLGSLLPFTRPDAGVILVSAVAMASAATLLALAIRLRTGDDLAALAAGWSFAFGLVVWFHATIAEVYAVQLACLLAFYAAAAGWSTGKRFPSFLALCFILGLTATSNVLLAVLLIPGFLYLTWFSDVRSVKPLLAGLGCLVLGLTPLLYIPLRIGESGFTSDFVYLSGYTPGSLRWYVWYLTAEEFTTTKLLNAPLTAFPNMVRGYIGAYLDSYSPILLVLSGAGLIASLKHISLRPAKSWLTATGPVPQLFERTVCIGLIATTLPVLPYDVADREVFFMPSFAHLVILAGFGLGRLTIAIRESTFPSAAKPWILRVLAGVAPVVLLISHYDTVLAITSDTSVYDQRRSRFDALPPSAIVVSTDDGRATRWKYWQTVLGLRPDLRIDTLGRLAPRYRPETNDTEATGSAEAIAPSLNLADRLRALQGLRADFPERPLYTVLDDRLPPELDHFRIRRAPFDPKLLRLTDRPPAETSVEPLSSHIVSSADAFNPIDIVGINIVSLDGGVSRAFAQPVPVERHLVDGVIKRSEFVDIEIVARKRESGQYFAEVAFVDQQLRIPGARGFTASRSIEIAPATLEPGQYVRDRITTKIPAFIPNGLHTLAVSLNAVTGPATGTYRGKEVRMMAQVEATRSWVGQTRYQPVARIWVD